MLMLLLLLLLQIASLIENAFADTFKSNNGTAPRVTSQARKWRKAEKKQQLTVQQPSCVLCVQSVVCTLLCMRVACFDFSLFIIDCKFVYRLLKAQLCCSCHWFSMPSSLRVRVAFFSLSLPLLTKQKSWRGRPPTCIVLCNRKLHTFCPNGKIDPDDANSNILAVAAHTHTFTHTQTPTHGTWHFAAKETFFDSRQWRQRDDNLILSNVLFRFWCDLVYAMHFGMIYPSVAGTASHPTYTDTSHNTHTIRIFVAFEIIHNTNSSDSEIVHIVWHTHSTHFHRDDTAHGHS